MAHHRRAHAPTRARSTSPGTPRPRFPPGLSDGLPVGLMIVGRRLGDGMCLRVAQGCETMAGGFPAPPG